MLVNHKNDLDTHAVIGGQNVQSFGMAQTAEFFTILSSTLYSNKPLAVIREVLCNAWDAHIAAGCTNKAVKITLDDEKLTIRDFGLGIPPEKMYEIYCVYGNSTKGNDGRQTGGFGLGSKAPFAYNDSFTVTTNHDHKKTVYAISRGSQLTDGKPDFRTMVNKMPTTESGLEVSIPIKEHGDVHMFMNIIHQIAGFGEMFVELNGKVIETIPISTGEQGLFICDAVMLQSGHLIYIRYGNVVYPLESNSEYSLEYSSVEKVINKLTSGYYAPKYKLIIQAEPNSISVTPSRESLSLTETTINTIKALLNKAYNFYKLDSAKAMTYFRQFEQEHIDKAFMEGRYDRLLQTNSLAATYADRTNKKYYNIASKRDYIYQRLGSLNAYSPNHAKIFNELMKMRLEALIKNNVYNKREIINLLKYRKLDSFRVYSPNYVNRFEKSILHPLYRALAKNDVLDPKRLVIHQSGRHHQNIWKPAPNYGCETNGKLVLTKKYIYITHSRRDIDMVNVGYIERIFTKKMGSLAYICKSKDKDVAKAFFEKRGYMVIDIASKIEEMKAAEREYLRQNPPAVEVKETPKPPKPKGLPAFSNILDPYGRLDVRTHLDNTNRSWFKYKDDEPEFVFRPYVVTGNYKHFFEREFDSSFLIHAVKLFGDKGIICYNENQKSKYLKAGAKLADEYFIDKVLDYVSNSKNITTYLTQYNGAPPIRALSSDLLLIADKSPVIKSILPKSLVLNEEESIYLEMFQSLTNYYMHRRHYFYKYAEYQKIISEHEKLSEKGIKNPLTTFVIKHHENLRALNLTKIDIILNDPKTSQKQKAFVETTLLLALS